MRRKERRVQGLEKSPWCTLPYSLDEVSPTPYTEIEVGPFVENNIDNDFNDKEV